MSLRVTGRVLSILAATALLALAATTAFGDGTDPPYPGSVVHVSVNGPLQAGKVLTITATGSNAAQDPSGGPGVTFSLDLFVVDPSILEGPCELSEQKELSDITNVPDSGRLLNFADLDEGSSGPFRIPERYEPAGFGPLMVCAYSKRLGADAAWASTQVQIKPAARGGHPGDSHEPAARPQWLARPVVHLAHGRLRCARGRWTNHPTQFRFRWKFGRGRFGSARMTGRLALPAAGRGMTVTCAVTASNTRGSGRATSRPWSLN